MRLQTVPSGLIRACVCEPKFLEFLLLRRVVIVVGVTLVLIDKGRKKIPPEGMLSSL